MLVAANDVERLGQPTLEVEFAFVIARVGDGMAGILQRANKSRRGGDGNRDARDR